MININQITAQLARMPDQALQQYAQMHKDDPYTLSLALAESNRRKQTRQGAQMGGQEQPKVVDQELQGMAAPMPEDVGIGQLPAGDMNFADGGIVAFSDGGDVNLSPAQVRQKLAEAVRNRDIEGAQFYRNWLETNVMPERPQAPRAVIPGGLRAPVRQEPTLVGQTPATQSITPAGADAGLERVLPPQAPAAAAGARPGAAPLPGAGAGQRVPPAGGPGAAAPSASGPAAPGITALQSPAQMYQNALDATPLVDPTASQREAMGKEMVAMPTTRLAERQAEIEKEGDVFKGRGERISKREEALGKDKEQMTGLAFLEAGLAVMSTPGGLATALGKGARVGTERFAAGLDKLRAAQERLEDAKDNLETLRLNRSDMNAKEIRAMKADIDRAKLDAQKLSIEGTALASGERYKRAGEIFKATSEQSLAVLKEAGANQRQQMASAATVQAAKIAAQQKTGRSEDELREIYAKSVVLQSRYPNINDYLTMMKGTAALQSGQQLNPADAALVNKYLR